MLVWAGRREKTTGLDLGCSKSPTRMSQRTRLLPSAASDQGKQRKEGDSRSSGRRHGSGSPGSGRGPARPGTGRRRARAQGQHCTGREEPEHTARWWPGTRLWPRQRLCRPTGRGCPRHSAFLSHSPRDAGPCASPTVNLRDVPPGPHQSRASRWLPSVGDSVVTIPRLTHEHWAQSSERPLFRGQATLSSLEVASPSTPDGHSSCTTVFCCLPPPPHRAQAGKGLRLWGHRWAEPGGGSGCGARRAGAGLRGTSLTPPGFRS